MSFWPTKEHWSVEIPLRTNHYLCPSLVETGFVALTPYPGEIDPQTIHTPGVFVQRVVALTPEQAADKRIERRTVSKEA